MTAKAATEKYHHLCYFIHHISITINFYTIRDRKSLEVLIGKKMVSWWRDNFNEIRHKYCAHSDLFHFSFRLTNKFNVFYLFFYFYTKESIFRLRQFFFRPSLHTTVHNFTKHFCSVSVSISFENYGICISIAILHSIHHIFASFLQFFRTYRFLLFWCMPGESAWTWKEPMTSATFITVSSLFSHQN